MDAKSNYGGNKNSLENEGMISKISNEIKHMLFRVFYLILKDEEQSFILTLGIQLIIFFQYCSFIFQKQIWDIWKQNIISFRLYKFFSYFLISSYFENLSFASYASMMYALIGLVIFSIIILLLIGFTTSSNKLNITFTWPIIILKILFTLFTSILFQPIMDFFFQMINCSQNENGTSLVYTFDQECWVGTHIIHGIVAIFGIVIFFCITLIINLLHFEPRYKIKDVLSKQSGRSKALYYCYIVILEICFNWIDVIQYDHVIIFIIFGGSFVCFWRFHLEQHYYNPHMQKLVSVQGTLMLWSSLLMLYAHYLEETIFHGIVYAWLIGIPLMAIAVYKKDKYDYDLLLLNYQKVDDPNLIIKLTTYIYKLLQTYQSDKNYNIMLDALLEVHRTTCIKDDCVLRIKNKNNQRFKIKDENISQRDFNIQLLLGEIFSGFIRKHQHSIRLRINYAFYILDILQQKQQALNEFISIEKISPSLDNEFIIFRYKKIIEEEQNNAQNENIGTNIDVASELAFQNQMRQLQNKIERATLMHMDFWSQLQEDYPDLGKMNEIGSQINTAIIQVEELWNKMQLQTQNLPKAMRLYGKFIIEVLQDKDYGEELLEKAKFLQVQNNKMKNKQQINIYSNEDLNFEPLPTLLVSTQQEKYTQITNINLSASNFLGYQKSELINRKINILIPTLFAKSHDFYVDQFVKSNDTNKLTKERFVYVKLKSGYITASYIYLKTLQSVDENIQLVAQFRNLKTFKNSCYILLDSDEVIEAISSSCICNLYIDQKMINHRKVYIHELFPQFNRNDYINKNGGQVILDINSTIISNSNYLQYYINDLEDQDKIKFSIQLTEIENEHHDQIGGYALKLEKIIGETSQIIPFELQQQQLGVPQQITNTFQFKYFAGKSLFVGEITDELNSARVDQSVIWEQQSSRLSEETQVPNAKTTEEAAAIPIINYAEGIRTVKLFDNRIQDIDDIRMNFSEEEESNLQDQSIFKKNQDQQEEQEFQINNIFRSRKTLNQAINNFKQPIPIIILNWIVNILIVIIVALSFTSYFMSVKEFDDVKINLNLIKYAGMRNAESNQIMMNVQNMEMLSLGIWNFTQDEADLYYDEQIFELNESISSMQSVNKLLMLNDLYINAQIEELHTQDVIKMQTSDTTYSNYDLFQATQQIISKALLIRDKNQSLITPSDEDVKFITYNLWMKYAQATINETNQYHIGLSDRLINNISTFLIIMIISASILFLSLCIIVLLLIQINFIQEQILQLFIDIPEKTVKYLYNKSENFISNLQVGEEEEVASDVSEEEQDTAKELNRTLRSKRRRKMFKNTNSFHRTQILVTFIIVCIFQGYFILQYFLNQTINLNSKQQISELNVTTRLQSYYRAVDNAERQLFLSRDIQIMNNDPYTAVMNNIDQNYQVDSSLHQEHALNQDVMNQDYYDLFQTLFMSNPCELLESQGVGNATYCTTFGNGSVYQGMAVAVAKYFESIRYLMTIYDLFWDNPSVNFTTAARGWGTFRNITNDTDNVTNYIYNLNNFQQAVFAREMQAVYIKGAFKYLQLEFIQGLNNDFSLSQTQLLAIFIVFEVLIFLFYFMLWLPGSLRITKDIWRTKGLIMMIPLKVIQKIKSIKEFVSSIK